MDNIELGQVPYVLGNYTLFPIDLGNGSFGRVYIAQDKKENIFAVKCLENHKFVSPNLKKRFKTEILLYYKLHHKNIVRIKDVISTSSKIYIFLEYCDSGNLETFQSNYYETFHHTPTLTVVQTLFKQIIQGFSYMASQKCVHRDIKLDNIMLSKTSDFLQSININEKKLNDFMIAPSIEQEQTDEDLIIDFCKKSPEFWNISYTKNEKDFENKLKEYTIKIIDLGFAKELVGEKTMSLVGNMYGFAPEIWKVAQNETKEYDAKKVDLWSIAISLYRFTFSKDAFASSNPNELKKKITEGNYIIEKPKGINITLEFIDLMNGLLRANYEERYGWDIVLSHPFFCKPIEEQTIFEFPQDNKIILNIYDKRKFLEHAQLREFMNSIPDEKIYNEENEEFKIFEKYVGEVMDKKKHIVTPVEIKVTKVEEEWSFVDVKAQQGEKQRTNVEKNKSFISRLFSSIVKK
jgi:serine/threonine protein kinase